MRATTFKCSACKKVKDIPDHGGTGYGVNRQGRKVCYECCALQDRAAMLKTGKAVLYLSTDSNPVIPGHNRVVGKVSNWPGTLSFPIYGVRKGNHNIAGVRYDVWFTVSGENWHGTQYGNNTQLIHCKRIKTA